MTHPDEMAEIGITFTFYNARNEAIGVPTGAWIPLGAPRMRQRALFEDLVSQAWLALETALETASPLASAGEATDMVHLDMRDPTQMPRLEALAAQRATARCDECGCNWEMRRGEGFICPFCATVFSTAHFSSVGRFVQLEAASTNAGPAS